MERAWDYGKAVKYLEVRYRILKDFPQESDIAELRKARDMTRRQGTRSDLGKTVPTWSRFCSDVGIPRRTADRWLEQNTKRIRGRYLSMRYKWRVLWWAVKNLFA